MTLSKRFLEGIGIPHNVTPAYAEGLEDDVAFGIARSLINVASASRIPSDMRQYATWYEIIADELRDRGYEPPRMPEFEIEPKTC